MVEESKVKDSDNLRPVEISGHQVYWRGLFHAWTMHEGKTMAIVERESGSVELVDPQYRVIKFCVPKANEYYFPK